MSRGRDRRSYGRDGSPSPRRRDRSPPIRKRNRRSSRKRDRYRSPGKHRISVSYRGQRVTSRSRSPRGRRVTRSRSRSPSSRESQMRREISRSPVRDRYRHDRCSNDTSYERSSKRKDVFDKNIPRNLEERKPRTETIDSGVGDNYTSTNQPINDTNSSKLELSQRGPQDTKPHILSTQPSSTKLSPKVAQSDASPRGSSSAQSPATPSNDSASSDIYDPEGPVIPISPGDSPPISPLNNAACNKQVYRPEGDKNGEDDVPSSAVQLNQQEKYLQKLNRQERVVEEVKLALKPHYQNRSIDKEQYKDVLRRAVPKVRSYVL